MRTSGGMQTLALHPSAPRKAGQEARAFRETNARHHPAAGCRECAPAEGCKPWLCIHPPQGKPGRKPGLSVKLEVKRNPVLFEVGLFVRQELVAKLFKATFLLELFQETVDGLTQGGV